MENKHRFKKGDKVLVTTESLSSMFIPANVGNIFTLDLRNGAHNSPYWVMTNSYVILESMLIPPTELLKALL